MTMTLILMTWLTIYQKPLIKASYKSLNPDYTGDDVFNYNECRKIYRLLSNTIHGKIITHESQLPDRFSHRSNDWHNILDLIGIVQSNLLRLFKNRFFDSFALMTNQIPAASALI